MQSFTGSSKLQAKVAAPTARPPSEQGADGDRVTCSTLATTTSAAASGPPLHIGRERRAGQSEGKTVPRRAGQAGILSAWVGTLLVMLVTAAVAVPLGIAAGIYLEEYAPRNWITDVIEINITNLAGVPSIVYGLLALGLFVYAFGLGQSIQTAGLTLALLILPVIIVATREAIRSIPAMIREAATLDEIDRLLGLERPESGG